MLPISTRNQTSKSPIFWKNETKITDKFLATNFWKNRAFLARFFRQILVAKINDFFNLFSAIQKVNPAIPLRRTVVG